jgi:outer membrane protein OmpA-like peptidoglycan-associated protein
VYANFGKTTNDPNPMTSKEALMKKLQYLILFMFIAIFFGCATRVPNELIEARLAYQHASEVPSQRLVPAELHKAQEALARAEQSFRMDSDSYKTKDLAYVAQRKSERAEAIGAMAADKASKDRANADYREQQAEIVKQGKQDLRDAEKETVAVQAELDQFAAVQAAKDQAYFETRKLRADRDRSDAEARQLRADKDRSDAEAQRLQAEKNKQELIDSEKRTADALAELARVAAVREEERGLVVTLSGSILFQSGESNLLSSARVKLDQVAHALLAVRARNLIVEGHTDSRGSDLYNQGLSERRADTVRDYLVHSGYPSDRIRSLGMGERNSIDDNASPEGRANNRRVEIIIERELRTSNP